MISVGWGQYFNDLKVTTNDKYTEHEFIEHYIWVVLSSGLRYKVVQKIYPKVMYVINGMINGKITFSRLCEVDDKLFIEQVLKVFGNRRKVVGIKRAAVIVEDFYGNYENFINCYDKDGRKILEELPYLGPRTSYHMEIGLNKDVAKPDRHLERVALYFSYNDVQEFCIYIKGITGDNLRIVDAVWWSFFEQFGSKNINILLSEYN